MAISLLRILLFVARPKTSVMGSIPNSLTYRSIEQYPKANIFPGILILHINAPIYFANASYLRERYNISILQVSNIIWNLGTIKNSLILLVTSGSLDG